jgi:predicted ester cyclase/quercetin dioxygenase-like cupin family protein
MKISSQVTSTTICSMFVLLAVLSGCAPGDADQDSRLEANKAVVMQAWEDGFSQGDLDAIGEVFDESYVELTPYGAVEQGGPERAKQAYEWMQNVFGDIQFEVEQVIAEGDFVFTRALATGTHVGEFMGVPATGRPVRFATVVISKVSNGKIVQDWSLIDAIGLLSQIGELSVEPLAARQSEWEGNESIPVAGPLAQAVVYSDSAGLSHFADRQIDFSLIDYAPPAPPVSVSQATPAENIVYLSSPAGWTGDWHTAPRRQVIFCLAGRMEVEVSDGEVRTFGPGAVLLVEDTSGRGHITRVVGRDRAYLAAVPFPETSN